ncbi:MAG: protein kinase, partial [Planctomycetes bacterium]|nr:protein kinase [Planctomycetota bacterium]
GQGGMGDVYLGHDESLERPVAIKVLPPELARHDDFLHRFQAEAAAVAMVAHANVVRVHLVGEDSGYHFFAMQYVEGESLAERLLRRRRVPLDEALSIVEQCLAGLGAAHEQGLVHRDVKPGNILVEAETDRVVLVDFGLVRRIDRSTRMTATGVIMGTVDYIAPEQVLGGDVDGRCDVYSLGVVFYQLLSGRLPFEAETPAAMMFQHVHQRPFSLRQAAPDVPQPVCDIVTCLMAKCATERYSDCAAVLYDIQAFREGRPVRAVPVEAADGALLPLPHAGLPEVHELEERLARLASVRFGDRLRDWLATRFRRHAPEFIQELRSTTHQVDAVVEHHERHRARLATLREEARDVAVELSKQIDANLKAGAQNREALKLAPDGADRSAAVSRSQACEEDLRVLRAHHDAQQEALDDLNFALDKLDATLAGLRSRRDVLKARLPAARGRPARRRRQLAVAAVIVVLVVGLSSLVAWNRYNRDPSNVAPTAAHVSHTGVIGDSSNVAPTAASVSSRGVTRDDGADAIPPGEIRIIDSPAGCVRTLAVTPDGRRVLGGTSQGALCVWEVASGRELFQGQPGPPGREILNANPRIALSSGGEHLAWCGQDKSIRIWDVEALSETHRIETTMDRLSGIAFSGDDDRVLAGGGSYWRGSFQDPLRVWDRQSGKESLRLDDPKELIDAVAYSGDGRHVLAAVSDHTIRLFDASDGRQVRVLEGHRGRIESVEFAPDGQHALSGSHDTTVGLWDLTTGTQIHAFVGHSDGVHEVAVSDGGRFALSCSADGTIRLWDLGGRREICALVGHTDRVRCVRFLPESRFAISGGDDGTVRVWRLPISDQKNE